MKNMFTFVQNKCLKYKEKTFLQGVDHSSISYNDFNIELTKCLNKIESIIPNNNDFNFSIIAPNSVNYLLFLLSLSKKNGSAVNLNPNLSEIEIKERLILGDVDYLICTESIYSKLSEIIDETAIAKVIIIDSDTFKFKIVNEINLKPFEEKLIEKKSQIAFLQFTGGTSGVIKAAVISHQNILENITQINDHFQKYTSFNDFKVLVAFPFYHVFSIVFNVLFILNNGGTCFIYQDLRNTKLIIRLIKNNPINLTVGVNTWYNKLMQHEEFKALDLSKLKISLAGGEYVPLSTKQKWLHLTGKPLFSAYGLTETSSLSIISPFDETNLDDSIGIPVPSTEVVLFDENNNKINEDRIAGEIAMKGPQITKAYYKNELETKTAFFGEWFKTGDIGERVDGHIYKIVDRKKDMISVSGNKVYPNEVESVIFKIEDVLDVGIVAKANEKSGERVAACIVLKKDSQLTKDDITNYCKNNLSSYKVPKNIYFYTELPKTAIGKTARRILKKEINNG
jgi:long-chain acyl-CoA synthetase